MKLTMYKNIQKLVLYITFLVSAFVLSSCTSIPHNSKWIGEIVCNDNSETIFMKYTKDGGYVYSLDDTKWDNYGLRRRSFSEGGIISKKFNFSNRNVFEMPIDSVKVTYNKNTKKIGFSDSCQSSKLDVVPNNFGWENGRFGENPECSIIKQWFNKE